MNTDNSKIIELSAVSEINDTLTDLIRQGAKQMLACAVEVEVQDFIARHADVQDDQGRRQVVRNGFLPERQVQTGVGSVDIKVPRVRDNSDSSIRFESKILPPYLKRSRSIEELLPWLYLKGISTGQFSEALSSLLGKDAGGLSANTISRLKSTWENEYEIWRKRDLSHLRIVYIWADGVYLRTRLSNKQCVLVIIGADDTGKKHVLGLYGGFRESEQSWKELLLELQSRGLVIEPKLAVGDGALGFWKAITKVYPSTKHQRCWLHKTMNILNKLPKSLHKQAKTDIHDISMAATKKEAEAALNLFVSKYKAKYLKASDCLEKDQQSLLSFYDFPAEHWHHLRTTNPIESLFSTVKLRTASTRGCLSEKTGFAMLYKLVVTAEKRWPRLRGSKLVADVIEGIQFKDGVKVLEHAA